MVVGPVKVHDLVTAVNDKDAHARRDARHADGQKPLALLNHVQHELDGEHLSEHRTAPPGTHSTPVRAQKLYYYYGQCLRNVYAHVRAYRYTYEYDETVRTYAIDRHRERREGNE